MNILIRYGVKLFILVAGIWTATIYVLFENEQNKNHQMMYYLAVAEARAHFDKDVLIRSWAASNGGVYVPPSTHTPPNPYLEQMIKDRDITTDKGKNLTLVNPAYMTRQLHELAKEKTGIQGHITSLHLTREANKPDDWEREALQSFEKGATETHSLQTIDGQKNMRYMGVLIAEKGCVTCHKNYKVGDVRGGISVTLPMARYEIIAKQQKVDNTTMYMRLWLFGIVGICLSIVLIFYLMRRQLRLENPLLHL